MLPKVTITGLGATGFQGLQFDEEALALGLPGLGHRLDNLGHRWGAALHHHRRQRRVGDEGAQDLMHAA